jgi:GT2 family glycosyltransferase
MQNRFAIGIPTYNRLDLLHPALLFYINDFPDTKIYIVDNGRQNIASKITHPNIEVIYEGKNLGVATSWNMLCKKIYENHEYAMILNDDIYLGREQWQVDCLVRDYDLDFFCTTKDWCAFILPKRTFELVGEFDGEFFPAYYEDNDYHYRMKLLNLELSKLPFLNPILFKSSQTIDKEPSINDNFLKNKQRFILKWGGEPNSETYKSPFNQ